MEIWISLRLTHISTPLLRLYIDSHIYTYIYQYLQNITAQFQHMGELKPQQLTKSPNKIDKEHGSKTPHKRLNARRGAKRLETADILPNCVQGGCKAQLPRCKSVV